MGAYVILHGDVWWRSSVDDTLPRHVCRGSEPFAICMDEKSAILHKHGALGSVQEWTDITRKKLRAAGLTDVAEALVIISFPVMEETISEVNACIETSGRIAGFTDLLKDIGARQPDYSYPLAH